MTATPTARARWALALLTVPCVVVVMDLTVLSLAMPAIVPDLGASTTTTLWITGVYGFVIAATGAAALAAFAVRQRRLAAPVLDLALLRIRGFSIGLVTNVMTSFVMFGVSLLLALYLQLALGLSPLLAALVNLPGMATLVLATSLVPRLARRIPARILIGGGLLLVSAGALLLTRLDGADDLHVVIVANLVMSAGVAPTTVLVTQIIIGAAPQRAAGTASGAAQAANELGGALSIAVLGGLASAIYRLALARAPGAGGYRGPDSYAALLGWPGDKPPALLVAARTAFVDGVRASVLVSAAVMIAIGVAVLIRLHRAATASPDEPSGPASTRPAPRPEVGAVPAGIA